jgi:hypothetical protein
MVQIIYLYRTHRTKTNLAVKYNRSFKIYDGDIQPGVIFSFKSSLLEWQCLKAVSHYQIFVQDHSIILDQAFSNGHDVTEIVTTASILS